MTIRFSIINLFAHSLNDQTVIFLTIQFNISQLFALSLNIKVLFDPKIGPY